MHSARAPGDEHGSGLRARRAHAGNLTPQAAAGSERGGARSATGPRCPQAPPRGWRRGGRGWWRVLKRRVAPAEDRSTRRAGLRPQPGGRARGGGGAGPAGAGWGRGVRASPGRAGPRRRAGSGGPGVTHAAVREAAAAAAAGAAGTGTGARLGRAPAASLRARSLALPPACSPAARLGSPPALSGRKEGAKDADKFPQQPQILAQAEAAAPTGQESASRRSARPERPRRGVSRPFTLRGASGRDPMRRAREGREIRSPGGERRRAVLQLLEAGIGRQEAEERT